MKVTTYSRIKPMRSPRHVAIICRKVDRAQTLTHLDTRTGTVIEKWTLWNRGDHWAIVDQNKNVVYTQRHNMWEYCWLWILDKATEIHELNRSAKNA